ncbi:uncharacterized protein [Typha angustifolia]|uniref:uncharacterized protein n=1 Tax=Typha angustifolia TaxID=59011 RepID=UPI003C2AC113
MSETVDFDYGGPPALGDFIVYIPPAVWQPLAGASAIGITFLLAFGFLTAATRYRLWHNNIFLRNFLGLASNPLYQWLGNSALIILQIPYTNELYLLWTVLLFTGFSSFYSISGYSQSGGNGTQIMRTNERVQFSNNMTVLLLLLLYKKEDAIYPWLFAIWGLSMLKIIEKMRSLSVANRVYGEENTKLVALYMSDEHKQNHEDLHPHSMRGYKYLLMGEKSADVTVTDYYHTALNTKNVITVDEAWQCGGRLLRPKGGDSDGRLKDLCLSFSLFKLIKRRFHGYPTAEADLPKTRAFVLEGLLADDEERPFRVVDAEIRFLRDFFYTKYPTPHFDKNYTVNGRNIDVIVTIVILSFVMLMEVWDFISYMFSDWAKILLLCKYMKQSALADKFFLDKVLQFMCTVNLWSTSYDMLGQYNLVKNVEARRLYFLYWLLTFGYMGKRIRRCNVVTKSRCVRVTSEVKKAIFNSLLTRLKQGEQKPSNGSETLERYALHADMAWACGEGVPNHTHMHTIMIWHIATSFLKMDFDRPSKKKFVSTSLSVAVSLSNYCAHLVVSAPELLPIDSNSSRFMFDEIFSQTKVYVQNNPRRCGKVETRTSDTIGDESQRTIVAMGARLKDQLTQLIDDEKDRWKMLAEFWAELILFLAPSKNSRAHERKLAEGGEFITHLWALLYHAGIITQSPSTAH